jgi:recombination protein RecT
MNAPLAPWVKAVADAEPKFVELAKIDGNLVTYQREAGFAMQSIGKSEFLQKCTAESIRNAVTNVANIGLSLNPAMKLAYLVPRDGACCLDISYIGLVKIATDSGTVLAVAAIPVRENDTFKWNGPFRMPDHIFDTFASEAERGEIRGVYTVARLSSGVEQVDVMRREEIDYIRKLSKAKRDDAPWNAWFEEMVKKTGIKRASKLWPRTERMSRAEAILNEHEGLAAPIEGTVVGKTVEMPTAKTESQAPAATEPKAGTSGEGATGSAARDPKDKALSPGARTTLDNAMKRAKRTEADLLAAGFPKLADLGFSRFNEVMDWLKKNPAKS